MQTFTILAFFLVLLHVSTSSRLDTPKYSFEKPRSCEEIQLAGSTKSGVYDIFSDDGTNSPAGQVLCDLETEGGGWTVIQRRVETVENAENFYRTWAEYVNGFGRLDNSFWIGLDNIAEMTKRLDKALRIELTDWAGALGIAHYDHFQIGTETTLYKLNVSGYSGGVGDSLNNARWFSTKDQDNDPSASNCSVTHQGAWWYAACGNSNLNGEYIYGSAAPNFNGIFWNSWRGTNYSLKRVEMKIRKSDFEGMAIL